MGLTRRQYPVLSELKQQYPCQGGSRAYCKYSMRARSLKVFSNLMLASRGWTLRNVATYAGLSAGSTDHESYSEDLSCSTESSCPPSLIPSYVIIQVVPQIIPMGCCGSTATLPSEPPLPTPAPAPQGLAPVLTQSQASPEMSSVPPFQPVSLSPRLQPVSSVLPPQPVSSVPPPQSVSRTRSRTGSGPESSRKFSQNLNPRSRTKSAPQLTRSFKLSLPKCPRARAMTLTAPKRSNQSESRPPMPGESNE